MQKKPLTTLSKASILRASGRLGAFLIGDVMKDFDSALQLCGFERVSILINMLHDTLGSAILNEDGSLDFDEEEIHACLYDEKCVKLLATAGEALCELYQHMGEWEYLDKPDKLKEIIQRAFDQPSQIFYTEEEAKILMDEFKEKFSKKHLDSK